MNKKIRKLLLDYGISRYYKCCLPLAELVERAARGEGIDRHSYEAAGAKYRMGGRRLRMELSRMERTLRRKYPEPYQELTRGETGPEALIRALANEQNAAPETN